MLNPLDDLLREIMLYETSLDETDPQTVRFQPPDDQLAQDVANLNKAALSVYLAELSENRRLRSNAADVQIENGIAYSEPAPERVDCHYVITAWSPTQRGGPVDPTLEEHGLLWEAVVALLHNGPLNPEGYYGAGNPALVPWTPRFQNMDLPTQVLTTEGYPKLGEFWMSMGEEARWRPAIHLIVTLPVAFVRRVAGPMVTTKFTEYLGVGGNGDLLLQIGGHVRRTVMGQPPQPVDGAWVTIEAVPLGASANAVAGNVITIGVGEGIGFRVGDQITVEGAPEFPIITVITPNAAGDRLTVDRNVTVPAVLPAAVRVRRVLQRTQTNAEGRFRFEDLHVAIPYRLRTGAPGYVALARDVTLPSPTGEYDFLFP